MAKSGLGARLLANTLPRFAVLVKMLSWYRQSTLCWTSPGNFQTLILQTHQRSEYAEGCGDGDAGNSSFSAARKPAALASVSSYSASGLESATMPAPTLKCARPSLQ